MRVKKYAKINVCFIGLATEDQNRISVFVELKLGRINSLNKHFKSTFGRQ